MGRGRDGEEGGDMGILFLHDIVTALHELDRGCWREVRPAQLWLELKSARTLSACDLTVTTRGAELTRCPPSRA